jgi:outer membrane protein assembly factor BamD
MEKCRNTIAEYEYLVGKFYYKKDSYNAALGRFEGLLKKYPDYKGEPEVLFYSAMSYKSLGQKEKAAEYLSRLVEKYPNNKLSGSAKKEISALKK